MNVRCSRQFLHSFGLLSVLKNSELSTLFGQFLYRPIIHHLIVRILIYNTAFNCKKRVRNITIMFYGFKFSHPWIRFLHIIMVTLKVMISTSGKYIILNQRSEYRMERSSMGTKRIWDCNCMANVKEKSCAFFVSYAAIVHSKMMLHHTCRSLQLNKAWHRTKPLESCLTCWLNESSKRFLLTLLLQMHAGYWYERRSD